MDSHLISSCDGSVIITGRKVSRYLWTDKIVQGWNCYLYNSVFILWVIFFGRGFDNFENTTRYRRSDAVHPLTAILVSFFPFEERGKVLGINTAAVYTGLSSGPFLGGLITQHFGWRYIFFVNVLLGLLSLIIAFRKLKVEWAEARGEKFDFIGSIAYGVTLIIIMYGFSILPKMYGTYLIILGVIGFYIFSRFELKVRNPVFNMNLFTSNKAFAFSNLAALINYSATFAVGFLLSFYLQYIKGYNPQTAGIILVSQPVIMAVFSPISGKISDKTEPRIVASTGMIITTIGLFILIFLKVETSLFFIITSLVFLGFGFALFSSPNTNAVLSSVDKKFLGVAASTKR